MQKATALADSISRKIITNFQNFHARILIGQKQEKHTKRQFHIHQLNINAETVINEINGGMFKSINSEEDLDQKG